PLLTGPEPEPVLDKKALQRAKTSAFHPPGAPPRPPGRRGRPPGVKSEGKTSGTKESDAWGLRRCKDEMKCVVCHAVGENNQQLKLLRNLYVDGVDPRVMALSLEVNYRELQNHAVRNAWRHRKGENGLNIRERRDAEVELLLKARMRDSWHVIGPTSA